MKHPFELNPELDLVLERRADVPVSLVWKAWTQAEHLKKWFVPAPWSLADCEVDLRPGGRFRTVMRSPEGELMDNGAGCYLEVVENERLVFTSALAPGFRPVLQPDDGSGMPFTAIILLEEDDGGTKYTAIAVHADPKGKETHEKMGFVDGWGKAFDQLVDGIKSGAIS